MKERGILFQGALVRGILERRKKKTRRVIKDLKITGPNPPKAAIFDVYRNDKWLGAFGSDGRGSATNLCPYGKPGDRLWVRETWWQVPEPSLRQLRDGADTWPKSRVAYDADESEITREQNHDMGWRLRPSIFMPRLASRITLEITDVRVERVRDISEEDAIAEGVTSKFEFHNVWNSINEKRGYGWNSNPWVWVISFRQVSAKRVMTAA